MLTVKFPGHTENKTIHLLPVGTKVFIVKKIYTAPEFGGMPSCKYCHGHGYLYNVKSESRPCPCREMHSCTKWVVEESEIKIVLFDIQSDYNPPFCERYVVSPGPGEHSEVVTRDNLFLDKQNAELQAKVKQDTYNKQGDR